MESTNNINMNGMTENKVEEMRTNGNSDDSGTLGPLCFVCNAPASNKCSHCLNEVYYCCDSHYDYHRTKNSEGEYQCRPFAIKYSEEIGRYGCYCFGIKILPNYFFSINSFHYAFILGTDRFYF